MDILIAEDESPKLSNIDAVICDRFKDASVRHARSVRSTIKAILARNPSLLLLDMSLPTFDVAPGEAGGRPQGFGGMEVLRYMDFHSVTSPVLVVTQYEAFPDNGKQLDLNALSARLRIEHPNTFKGCVYYGALSDSWRSVLKEQVENILTGGLT